MKIYIATDHAGYELKNFLVLQLEEIGHEVTDFGAKTFEMGDDYPDYVSKVGEAISNEARSLLEAKIAEGGASSVHGYIQTQSMGIVLGGSGTGEAIAVNRYPNVRAFAFTGQSKELLELSRQHNDCNVLSIGARFVTNNQALETVLYWLRIEFGHEERHQKRLDEIEKKGADR